MLFQLYWRIFQWILLWCWNTFAIEGLYIKTFNHTPHCTGHYHSVDLNYCLARNQVSILKLWFIFIRLRLNPIIDITFHSLAFQFSQKGKKNKLCFINVLSISLSYLNSSQSQWPSTQRLALTLIFKATKYYILQGYRHIPPPYICDLWLQPLTSDRSCFSFPVRLSLCPDSFFMLPSDPLSWFFIIRSSRACTSFSKAAILESYKTKSPLGSYHGDVPIQACIGYNLLHLISIQSKFMYNDKQSLANLLKTEE